MSRGPVARVAGNAMSVVRDMVRRYRPSLSSSLLSPLRFRGRRRRTATTSTTTPTGGREDGGATYDGRGRRDLGRCRKVTADDDDDAVDR